MDVQDIVRDWLEKNGFDGLVDDDYSCSCVISDLAPCCDMPPSCIAGHKVECECGEGCDFHIAPGKAGSVP